MINEYLKNNCIYDLNKLDNYIYLYDINSTKVNYTLDDGLRNGTASITDNAKSHRIYCDSIEYNSTSSIDNRFSFDNQLTVNLFETKNKSNYKLLDKIINGNWMVVIKNSNNESFIINVENPIMVKYDNSFTDNNEPNKLKLTFESLTNIPTLHITNSINYADTWRDIDCEYINNRISSLQLIEYDKCKIKFNKEDFELIQDNYSLKTIQFTPSSMSFVDSFDGREFKQQLTFKIPFNAYKYYFHYNILEFIYNKYIGIIQTMNGNIILSGYMNGLFPSYTIASNSDENSITINLNASYTSNYVVATDRFDSIVNKTFMYKKVQGECINNLYTVTLIRKYNMDNTPLDEYCCLEGMQDRYKNYNIIETYDRFTTKYGIPLIDYSINCQPTECIVNGLPNMINLTHINENKCYNVTSECQITLGFDNQIINATYIDNQLCVKAIKEFTSTRLSVNTPDNATRYVTVNYNSSDNVNITHNINAKQQVVNIIPLKPISQVKSITSDVNYNNNPNGNGYQLNIEENTETIQKQYKFDIQYNDNTIESHIIVQDRMYYKYINNGKTICDENNNLYEEIDKYKGYDSTNIDIFVEHIRGNLIETNSSVCGDYTEELTEEYVCVDNILYRVVRLTQRQRPLREAVVIDTYLQYVSDNCEDKPNEGATSTEFRVNREKSICVDGKGYYVEEKWAEYKGKWYVLRPYVTRPSNQLSNDVICDVIEGGSNKTMIRWVDSNETYCLIGEQQINCTSAVTEYVCEGVDKYKITTKYVSPLCNGQWIIDDVPTKELFEKNSIDCGYVPPVDLAFEYDTSSKPNLIYTLNNKEYTATTSPYSTSLQELGVDVLTNCNKTFYKCGKLTKLIKFPNTSAVTDMYDMFYDCSGLTSLNISSFDTSKVTDMGRMFFNFDGLTSLDLSSFNTSNVTNLGYMFCYCSNLTSLNLSGWNTSNVTDMSGMFDGCSSLTSFDLSNFNTSQVTNIHGMFDGCSSLTSLNLSNFNTSNVTDISWMFSNCHSLTSLNISSFNTYKVTDMFCMFNTCNSLTSLDLSNFNTSNVTNMNKMFFNCNKLTSLNLSNFNTSKVTNMHGMFSFCNRLTLLDVSHFDTSNVTDMNNMFNNCTSLKTLVLGTVTQSQLDWWKARLTEANILSKVTIQYTLK